MIRFFKELLEVHADRWRYMFGVGSFWSIFIPLIIVAALVLNMIMTSKHQYTSDDLSESYSEGYNKACDEHASDYDEGYNSGYDDSFEETWDIAYDEGYSDGYSKAEGKSEKEINLTYREAFHEGYHYGYQDGSGEYTTGLVSIEEVVSSVAAYEKAQSARNSN